MALHIVTRAFQFRGGVWRSGQSLELSEREAADPFVAAHVRRAGEGEGAAPAPAPHLGNGVEVRRGDAPARAAHGESGAMSQAELKAALAKLGVPCPPNARRADLEALYANAQAAVAGSPDEPSGPKLSGR